MSYQIIQGDNRDTLKTIPDNSIDAIVTDPPYGIDFLGKAWDANTGALETYQECLRVLKPGGHILAFSAARTYHHLAVTLEQAGFEIRDQIMWIYSSGFPKSQDVGKAIDKKAGIKHNYTYTKNDDDTRNVRNSGTSSTPYCIKCDANMTYPPSQCKEQCSAKHPPIQSEWQGWGSSLKPAHEPIALARKPIKLSIAKNVQKWGTGALNIDATRVPYENQEDIDTYLNNKRGPMERGNDVDGKNIRMFNGETGFKAVKRAVTVEQDLPELGRFPSNVIGEIQEEYQKYFYCPKVSRKERHMGFDEVPDPLANYAQGEVKNHPLWDPSIGTNVQRLKHKILEHNKTLGQSHAVQGPVGNNHPTVKPIELMKYLIKLVTPPGGTVLDPFNGSGSTGCAAVELGFNYIGCELDPAYVEISLKRIEAWNNKDYAPNLFQELFSNVQP